MMVLLDVYKRQNQDIRDTQNQLDSVNEQKSATMEQLEALESQLKALADEIAALEVDLAAAEENLANQQSEYDDVYKRQPLYVLQSYRRRRTYPNITFLRKVRRSKYGQSHQRECLFSALLVQFLAQPNV